MGEIEKAMTLLDSIDGMEAVGDYSAARDLLLWIAGEYTRNVIVNTTVDAVTRDIVGDAKMMEIANEAFNRLIGKSKTPAGAAVKALQARREAFGKAYRLTR